MARLTGTGGGRPVQLNRPVPVQTNRTVAPLPTFTGSTSSGSYGGGAGGAGGMPDMQGMMQQYMGMANQMANFRAQQDERQMGIAYNYRTQEANRDAANQMRLQNQQLQSQERQSGRQLASQERMQAGDLALRRDQFSVDAGIKRDEMGLRRDQFGSDDAFRRERSASEDRFRSHEFAVKDRQHVQSEIRDMQKFEADQLKQRQMQTENLGHQKWSQESSQGHGARMQAEQLANQRTMQTEREQGQDRRLGMNINNQQTMQERGFGHQVNMTNLNEKIRQGKVNDDRSAAQAMFRSSGGAGRGALR